MFLVLLLLKFEQILRKKCLISLLLVCNFTEFGFPLFYFCVNFCEKTDVLIGPQQLLWVQKLSFSNLEFIDQRYFLSRFTYFDSDVSHSAIIGIQWSVVRRSTCYFQHRLFAKPKFFLVCRSIFKNLTKTPRPRPSRGGSFLPFAHARREAVQPCLSPMHATSVWPEFENLLLTT